MRRTLRLVVVAALSLTATTAAASECILPNGCAGGAWSSYYAAPIYPFGWYGAYGMYGTTTVQRPHRARPPVLIFVHDGAELGDFHPIEPAVIPIK